MKLVVLQLDANHLTSLLAQKLCQSSSLQNFTANSNHLIGPIPKTVKNLPKKQFTIVKRSFRFSTKPLSLDSTIPVNEL